LISMFLLQRTAIGTRHLQRPVLYGRVSQWSICQGRYNGISVSQMTTDMFHL
jgi:hypothetical protein